MPHTHTPSTPPNPQPRKESVTLLRNLALLARRSPRTAEAIAHTPDTWGTMSAQGTAPGSAHGGSLATAPDGAVTGLLSNGQRLASAHAPLKEAQRWADAVDISGAAVFAIRGFGLGHHVAALSRRLATDNVVRGALIVLETDLPLLRAALSVTDFTKDWATCPVFILTDEHDKVQLSEATTGLEGLVSLGTRLLDHPPSKQRIGPLAADAFGRNVAAIVSSVRTSVVTTMVHVETTVRNLLNNINIYTSSGGVATLAGSCAGVPAIVVSAGPSLHKTIAQLKDPSLRERVVIIAVQTVLRTLLDAGIRPHFVASLDHHEISARFYEGLSREDVEGVTLIIEPKCNPAVPRAFPGRVLCAGDELLDEVLGKDLSRPLGRFPAGATVAHLCYHIARHLSCEPVLLVGQDLGFTDNHYYAPRAAIHRVWGCELSEFRTLESMEWERVARMRGLLRSVSDQEGKPVYTDEQMSTYQVMFERLFEADALRGLTTIDATGGGTMKEGTRVMPLALALERYSTESRVPAALSSTHESDEKTPTPQRVQERLALLQRSVTNVIEACKRTILDLSETRDLLTQGPEGEASAATIIDRVQAQARAVVKEPSFSIINTLNQTGTLNRYKADRAIAMEAGLKGAALQRKQVERDLVNVQWLGEAARQLQTLLAQGEHVLRGGAPQTREHAEDAPPTPPLQDAPSSDASAEASRTGSTVGSIVAARPRVVALLHVDAGRSSLATKRSPWVSEAHRDSALQRTLARLDRCKELDAVVIATPHAARVRGLLGDTKLRTPLTFAHVDAGKLRARRQSVAAARLWSRHSWRGGAGSVTLFDELILPEVDAQLLAQAHADAAYYVSDDWCLVDPALSDSVIARHRELPQKRHFTFSQAAPGFCGCVVSREMVEGHAQSRGAHSTIGYQLCYSPDMPRMDPIGRDPCINVHPSVRDCAWRATWDDANFQRLWADILTERGKNAWLLSAQEACAELARVAPRVGLVPEVVTLDVRELRRSSVARVAEKLRDLASLQPALALTIIDHDASGPWRELADAARCVGVAGVHLRTTHEAFLACGHDALMDTLDLPLDVVSVELPADSRTLWESLTGHDGQEGAWAGMQSLLDARNARLSARLPRTWIVPRITRSDATLDELEVFYDRWTLAAGACVIDANHAPKEWERLCALPEPDHAIARRAWSRITWTAHDLPRAEERWGVPHHASSGTAGGAAL